MSYRRRLSSLSAGRGRCATFAKEHHLELGLWRRCRLRGGSHEKLEEWAAEVPLEALMGLEGSPGLRRLAGHASLSLRAEYETAIFKQLNLHECT